MHLQHKDSKKGSLTLWRRSKKTKLRKTEEKAQLGVGDIWHDKPVEMCQPVKILDYRHYCVSLTHSRDVAVLRDSETYHIHAFISIVLWKQMISSHFWALSEGTCEDGVQSVQSICIHRVIFAAV